MKNMPKTRSGKILRGIMKNIVNSQEYKMPATIEDERVLDYIKDLAVEWRI